jgi:heme oxygenase
MELFMSLKKMTDSIHRKAEQTKWAQLLVSGNMSAEQYGLYLYNQSFIYSSLESRISDLNLLDPVYRKIFRTYPLSLDLFAYYNTPKVKFDSTDRYIDYVQHLDKDQAWAHLYVRHFGDMYGGQIIAKKAPLKDADVNAGFTESSHAMYEFENKSETIRYVRSNLKDEMADEAILCFQFAIDLFQDLEEYFDL